MDTLELKGFKCFTDETLQLNKLTILTGENGSGKSSVIQSLLLLRQINENVMQNSGEWNATNVEIKLNDYRKLQLGTFDDVCNIGADGITIILNGIPFELVQGQDNSTLSALVQKNQLSSLPTYMTSQNFFYLNAERIGPRKESAMQPASSQDCGDTGEWAGNVLMESSRTFPKVDSRKSFPGKPTSNFNILVDRWMSYIFTDISIKSDPITTQTCQIKLRGPKVTTITPNTGFGYTYALPIVIDGLKAQPGSLLMIENPEAHLHPRAQSNIGFFLGRMVSAGINVIVETHSEHVVNGIRRAALSGWGLGTEDISIYFFERGKEECPYTKISIDENGNLSDFPVDFFDQVRQDMLEIIRLSQLHKTQQ